MTGAEHIYDLAVSFAGEQRDYVERVVAECKARDLRVFYDRDAKVNIWGRNFIREFRTVYGGTQAHFFVPFLSTEYLSKAYPMDEFHAAMVEAINRRTYDYILPVIIGDVRVPSDLLSPAIGFLRAEDYPPETLASIIAERVASTDPLEREAEATNGPPAPPRRRRWVWFPAAGLAVAAAIVLLAVFLPGSGASTPPSAPPSAMKVATKLSATTVSQPDEPVAITGITRLDTGTNLSLVSAQPLRLNTAQLAEVNDNPAPDASTPASVRMFLAGLDLVPTGGGSLNVTVTGNDASPVTINSMTVVKQCQAALTGTLFFKPSSGIDSTIGIGFDLGSPLDYAQDALEYHPLSGNYFAEHVLTLEHGETHTFTIRVLAATAHDCRFTFRMTEATTDRGQVTETIDNGGRPFELSDVAPQAQFQVMYAGGVTSRNNQFMPVDPKTFHF